MIGIRIKGKRNPHGSKLPVWAWGRDHLQPGETFAFQPLDSLAGGIAPGNKNCLAEKWEGNEDALGALAFESGTLLLLADSHFGRFAGEQALTLFETAFQATQGPGEKRLFLTLLQLDGLVRAEKSKPSPPIHPSCATTLIAAWIVGDTLTWCSVGDSFLWHLRDADATLLNERTQVFLADAAPLLLPMAETLEAWHGTMSREAMLESSDLWWNFSLMNRYVRGLDSGSKSLDALIAEFASSMQHGTPEFLEGLRQSWHPWHLALQGILPEWGKRRLQAGDRLVMASDGAEERVSGISTEAFLDLAAKKSGSLKARVRQMLSACNGRRGGADNLCCWLWEHPGE